MHEGRMLTRREVLKLGAGGLAVASSDGLIAGTAEAQAPKRGGVFHVPGQVNNASGVNDPKVTEMIRLQRRTFDVNKRKEIIFDLQRYLAEQVYMVYGPSVSAVAAWEPYVKNCGPNFGHDYGGRLMVAWLDK